MEHDNLRYSGPPTTLRSYMNEFLVECPKCKREALVTAESPPWGANGKLVCKNCMHTENASDLVRYKSTVKRHCDDCGKEFEAILPNQKEKINQITTPCPNCGATRTYKPKNEAYKIGYATSGQAADPIFGLPLWFQTEIRGNLFWAYNRNHLNEIKSYVTSKLRERQVTGYTTMVEKLPSFIIDSKNRETIVKIIERLERKNLQL